MASALQGAINFLKDFGLFDVVLPFLLVFALVFAILEKTRILGTEENKPKKNLNAIVALVSALLVVATNSVVTAINETLPNIVLIIVIFVSFLMMIGTFMKTGEMDFAKDHEHFMLGFTIVSLIAIVLIVLNSIKQSSGDSWLDFLLDYVVANTTGPVVMSIVLLIVAVVAIIYVTKTPSGTPKPGGSH